MVQIKYQYGDHVPTDELLDRIDVLSDAVRKGREGIDREFYMSIPARLENDADLVLDEIVKRIREVKSLLDKNYNDLPSVIDEIKRILK